MKIVVTPEMLKKAAQEIENLCGDYAKEYNALFADVEAMKNAWKGKDNIAFTNKIEGFKPSFETMKGAMEEYAAFLLDAANHYTNVQDVITDSASRLFNGSN